MNGELAGCEFKWEFSPILTDPMNLYTRLTEPIIGLSRVLLRNQSRLVQLLEAKDQEIQDYTLNGAVLSRKSLQTTIFDPKEALIIPPNFQRKDVIAGLVSTEYSEALKILQDTDQRPNTFTVPVPPANPKISSTTLDKKPLESLSISNNNKKTNSSASSTASLMKAPKPMHEIQRDLVEGSQILPGCSEVNKIVTDNCTSPQAKRTKSSSRSKNLLKKL